MSEVLAPSLSRVLKDLIQRGLLQRRAPASDQRRSLISLSEEGRALMGRVFPPVLDGYTGEQRFFMGWSQVWREKAREERKLQLLTIDPHSPTEFRANGAAINHDGFHEAFKTKPGDKMFKPAADRIRIW